MDQLEKIKYDEAIAAISFGNGTKEAHNIVLNYELKLRNKKIIDLRNQVGFKNMDERPRCGNCDHLFSGSFNHYCNLHKGINCSLVGEPSNSSLHGICNDWKSK